MISRVVKSVHTAIHHVLLENKRLVKSIALLTLAGLYVAYLGIAAAYTVRNNITVDWCDGVGMIFILTALLIWGLTYYFILKKYLGKPIRRRVFKPIKRKLGPVFRLWLDIFIFLTKLDSIPYMSVVNSGQ